MDKAVGERIRSLREERKVTRERFAEEIEISVKFLYEIEKAGKGFSAEILLRISNALNVSCDYILFGKQINTREDEYFRILTENEHIKKKYLEEILKILHVMMHSM